MGRNNQSRVQSPEFRVTILCAAFLLFTLYSLLFTGYAQVVSSKELIENTRDYDGKTVEYHGEIVGDVLVRGDGAWINVYDGENAIGVWTDAKIKKRITCVGSYKCTGDLVLVKGDFRRACPIHGGDLDIHSNEIHLLKKGQKVERPLSKGKAASAIVLAAVAGCLMLADLLWKKK